MYSNAVKIAGLNDYLNPSEECVLPLVKNDNKYEIKINNKNSDIYTLKNHNKSGKNLLDNDIYKINNLKVGNVDKNKRITVGLSDCLSCSGCLTSSEEILLKDDNHLKVLDKMKEAELCIVSISPQTIFMFSSYFNKEPKIVLKKLSYLFRKLGANFVFDIGLSELLSLKQSKEEFISRYLKQKNNNKEYEHILSPNNNNNNSNDNNEENNNNIYINTINNNDNNNKLDSNDDYVNLPIISSHCPGWTLYAEKTLEKELVDKISRVPSSQVIQGLLVKTLGHTINYYNNIYEFNYFRLFNPYLLFDNRYELFSKTTSTNKQLVFSSRPISFNNIVISNKINKYDKIYHICVVPCYDKKFEMIRNEYQLDSSILSFYNNSYNNNTNDNNNEKDNNDNKGSNKDNKDKDENKKIIKESLVDDILSTGDIGKILDELKIDFEDLKEQEIDYLFDYIYYFNKFIIFKLFGSNNFNNNKDNKNKKENNINNNTININPINDNDYFNSYRDCLENTNLRNLIRCSELYCQSGGFAEEIFRYSCYELFSRSTETIHFKEAINQDFKECVLYDSNNNVLLRFIIAYGFKNIQNIIRLLKTTNTNNTNKEKYRYNNKDNTNKDNNKTNEDNSDINNKNKNNNYQNNKIQSPVYHYIELMSCPGGCFNGAGQRIDKSLFDNIDDNINSNDYFNIVINKIIPEKYQNNIKLNISKILEKIQMEQILESVDNIIKIINIIKDNTYNKDSNSSNDNNKENNKSKNNKDNKNNIHSSNNKDINENNNKQNNKKYNNKNNINSNNNKAQQKIDIQTTSSDAYKLFLKEAKYISTEDPICQYFFNFLKLSKEIYNFKLNLNSHKDNNISLKW